MFCTLRCAAPSWQHTDSLTIRPRAFSPPRTAKEGRKRKNDQQCAYHSRLTRLCANQRRRNAMIFRVRGLRRGQRRFHRDSHVSKKKKRTHTPLMGTALFVLFQSTSHDCIWKPAHKGRSYTWTAPSLTIQRTELCPTTTMPVFWYKALEKRGWGG
jgi:hypothetical protein